MSVKLLLVVEVEDAADEAGAQARLDAFQEAVVPSREYGLTFYRATVGDHIAWPPNLHPDASALSWMPARVDRRR